MISEPHILVLDYSTSRIATPTIEPWISKFGQTTSLHIDSEESFPQDLLDTSWTHVIHSGSELSITESSPFTTRAIHFIRKAAEKGIPQMGICYGHQLLCLALVGGESVRTSPNGFEAGWEDVRFSKEGQALLGVHQVEKVWQHHFDEVVLLPNGATTIATSNHTPIQAWTEPSKRLLGVQFHPEVVRRMGNKIFRKDRALLEAHGFDLDQIVLNGPSPNIGKAIFNFFVKDV